jgi:hypothetical protein
MSVKVSSWVWHEATSEVNGNELILLLALADVADDNGRCRYLADDDDLTYDGLARKVRVDRRTIERLIPKLRARGLVEQTRGAKGRPNEFAILVPWVRSSTDNVSENGESDSPTAVQDSPTDDAAFPDKAGSRTSYRRTDVTTRGERTRGVRIPEPFIVTKAMREWAAVEVPLVDVDSSTRVFVDYWRAATRNATKRDWVATWRNWLRKDQADAESRGGRRRNTLEHGAEVDALLRSQEQQLEQLAVTG